MALPLGLVAACWTPIGAGGLVWVAGHLASWTTGHGWRGPAFTLASGQRLLEGGPTPLWPGVPPELVWTLSVVLLSLALVPVVVSVLLVLSRRHGATERSFAAHEDVAAMLPAGVARRAEQLRTSLKPSRRGARRPGREDGVLLGRLRTTRGAGPELRASWEDVVLAVMAPRAGKTTALAVPAVLDAPGPVVATSNKPDLWATTHARRADASGQRSWVFDPQGITGVERTWWWNPLRSVKTIESAHRLAGHFVQEVRGDKGHRDFWTSAAHDLLTGLLLAAGLGGRTLVEVYEWLNDPVIGTPASILHGNGQPAAAASLTGRQNGAPETRDGIYETARTAAQCLRDPRIMAWVLVADTLPELVPERFVHTREVLYLLSKDGAGAAAPLVAALTDCVMHVATRAAERAGSRLDPPMVVVLDEAANVCRIAWRRRSARGSGRTRAR